MFKRLPSEELRAAVGQLFRGRTVNDLLRWRGKNELLARIRQCVVRDQRSDVAQLGSVGLEEFSARGDTIKNIGDADRRSRGQPRRLYVNQLASRDFNAPPFSFRF